MTSRGWRTGVTRALGGAALVAALARGTELRAQPRTPRMAPRFAGTSFVLARYTAGASLSVYGAKRCGAAMAVVGIVGNPETKYRAVIVGGGTGIRFGTHAGVTALLAGQHASDGASLRLYVLPRAAVGRVQATATGALKQPLGRGGRREASIDPLAVTLRVSGAVRVGITGVVSVAEQRAVDWGVGPSAHLRVPGGFISLEIVSRAQSDHLEVRGAFSASLK